MIPQVEAWLCRVEESMKSTIRHVMGEAVTAYEEKPREKWVFEYPAQVRVDRRNVLFFFLLFLYDEHIHIPVCLFQLYASD